MPADRGATRTLPQALRAALAGGVRRGLEELSRELHVSEKELPGLLEKLSRTLARAGEHLRQEPPRCLECGFEFGARTRARRPSRCPRCSSERLTKPRFWIE